MGEKIVRRLRWPGRGRAVAQFPAQYWFAGVIEFFGGVLVAIGLFTGYAAFIVSGEMAVAYFQNQFPKDWQILNTGERAVFYCFTFLFIASGAFGWPRQCFQLAWEEVSRQRESDCAKHSPWTPQRYCHQRKALDRTGKIKLTAGLKRAAVNSEQSCV